MIKKIIDLIRTNVIVKASLSLSIITCLIKLAGYFEKVLLAYYWGTGFEADCYNAIFAFLMSILVFFREIIEPGFLNAFLKVKTEKNERESWKVFYSILWCLVVCSIIITCLLYIYPDYVIKLLLPGFSGERFLLASKLLKISSIACIFIIISALTNITLNAHKKFTLAAIGDFVYKVTIILFILLWASNFGIYSAVYGIIFGAIIKLIIHYLGLKKNINENVSGINYGYLKNVWMISWPLLIGIIFSQFSSIIDNIFASYLQEGSISALNYSKKIIDLPVIILPYALSCVVFPYFTQLGIENNLLKIKKQLYLMIKWISILFIPIAFIFLLFSNEIIQLIFERGAFNKESTMLTAKPLVVYSLGILAFAIETVLVITFFSISDTKTPVLVGIICVILNIIITWYLIDKIHYLSIAWGLVISKNLKVIILLLLFDRKVKNLALEK